MLVVAEHGRLVKNRGRVRKQGRGGKFGRRNCIANVGGDQGHSGKKLYTVKETEMGAFKAIYLKTFSRLVHSLENKRPMSQYKCHKFAQHFRHITKHSHISSYMCVQFKIYKEKDGKRKDCK